MTRYEWLLLRKKQGYQIITCKCGFSAPDYLFWIHEWKTGHYNPGIIWMMEINYGNQETQAT